MALILLLAQSNQPWIEQYYTKIIYLKITLVLSSLSDLFPFSLTESLFYISIILVITGLIHRIVSVIKKQITYQQFSKKIGTFLFISSSIMVIYFYLAWGLNFFRIPLQERIFIQKNQVTLPNLYLTMDKMITRLNKLYTSDVISLAAMNDYTNIGMAKVIREFDHSDVYKVTAQKSKTLTLNILFDKMNIAGITSPFLHEIHYNQEMLPVEIPFTLAHEKAHLNGYTNEAEANFIGYLACQQSDNQFCQFSAELKILPYFFYILKTKDKTKYLKYKTKIRVEVLEIYRLIAERIIKNRGWLADIQKKMNDLYLKVNRVKKGIGSYHQVVDLILGYNQFPK